jgi:hypothetical protein
MEVWTLTRGKDMKKPGKLQNLKDRFPYNPYAIVAELKLASHFLNKEYLPWRGLYEFSAAPG